MLDQLPPTKNRPRSGRGTRAVWVKCRGRRRSWFGRLDASAKLRRGLRHTTHGLWPLRFHPVGWLHDGPNRRTDATVPACKSSTSARGAKTGWRGACRRCRGSVGSGDLSRWSFDSSAEFYASATDAEAENWKIGIGLYNYPLYEEWPLWKNSSMGTIRHECKFLGAVQYADGRPIRILEHRPQSLFIAFLIGSFKDQITYWQQFDPVIVGHLTELAFLELPERACLVQKHQFDCIELAGDDTRPLLWDELTNVAKSNTWYVFRNRAHFDAWLEQKNRLPSHAINYPLEKTGWDPFHLGVFPRNRATDGKSI